MKPRQVILATVFVFVVIAAFGAPIALAQVETQSTTETAGRTSNEVMAIVISVAVVVGLACISAGYAVGRVGAAALGAASERPELLGRSLILVGLAEGIAIYGLIIGIMLMRLL